MDALYKTLSRWEGRVYSQPPGLNIHRVIFLAPFVCSSRADKRPSCLSLYLNGRVGLIINCRSWMPTGKSSWRLLLAIVAWLINTRSRSIAFYEPGQLCNCSPWSSLSCIFFHHRLANYPHAHYWRLLSKRLRYLEQLSRPWHTINYPVPVVLYLAECELFWLSVSLAAGTFAILDDQCFLRDSCAILYLNYLWVIELCGWNFASLFQSTKLLVIYTGCGRPRYELHNTPDSLLYLQL